MKIKRLIIFATIIVLLILLAIYHPKLTGETITQEYEKQEAHVIRVIDGDTIETDLGMIRLLGINTPEKAKFQYVEAKHFLKQIENQTVFLLRDFDDKDKYDRLLRYVFYENKTLNIDIVELGLAISYMTDGLKYQKALVRAEDYARESELGIWQHSDKPCAECLRLIELDPREEYFILENICDFGCDLAAWYVQDSSRNVIQLDKIAAKQEKKTLSPRNIWNNDHDSFFLRDPAGKLVIYHSY